MSCFSAFCDPIESLFPSSLPDLARQSMVEPGGDEKRVRQYDRKLLKAIFYEWIIYQLADSPT